MNILIENAVPLNNGDAALIFSIGNQFESKGDTVYYSTFNYKRVKEKYPNKNWIKSPLTKRIITRVPGIDIVYLSILLLLSPIYRKIDAVVSAPGGYINSFYGINKKIKLLGLFKKLLNKPVYMYSQSIGYLSNKDEEMLAKAISNFELFYVRDKKSMDRIKNIGSFPNVYQTKDAAFLLPINHIKSNKKTNKVAISVREWNEKPKEIKNFKNNIKKIVKYLVDKGYEITFLSTCQGELGYPDDSTIAKEIVDELLNEDMIKGLLVDDSCYTLEQLIHELDQYEFVIGTRLHMCILSWINGIPAFNISYEDKGIECFNYLGISEYSIEYGKSSREINERLESFLTADDIQNVFMRVSEIHDDSQNFFEKMYENMSIVKR
ncbi:polysaccharide pyruvyl transferase family protein [Lactococcus lactis]|uniref:polysaccharide pyruvyl transferase family protein n=1 Tax=Lactococcus lactis TaxID=1358 RepID=UPI001651B344|nr:polysaccharide pyruvyl transferase family protein [Lactococcus lactis]QNL92855.1 polysaccharide pyruvyl transferase family protein [Lactococcus lactis]